MASSAHQEEQGRPNCEAEVLYEDKGEKTHHIPVLTNNHLEAQIAVRPGEAVNGFC